MASKWLHFDVLCETEELEKLFQSFGEPFYIYSTLGVGKTGEHALSQESFLDAWQRYLDELKAGLLPEDRNYRFFFTAVCTKTLDAIRAVDIGNERQIIISYEPLLQMQIHRFSYSSMEKKIYSMSFGEKSVFWGIRISYPQLFQYPNTRVVEDALDASRFCNAELFSHVKNWVRKTTQPTPFMIEDKKVMDPMRISKASFSWINNHAGLKACGLIIGV